MSTETILSRMMSDAKFAESVFTDAAKALAEYKLSADDLAKFKGLSRAQFEAMTPEERKSFVVGIVVHDRGGGGSNHNQSALSVK
ncbi:MAG: hypothetical protein HFACDABA_00861 [Anaerolineales bacterium]|nr:hypothetical protein [Anaerolineales bacterium]